MVFSANNSEPIIEELASPAQKEHSETLENAVEDYDPYTEHLTQYLDHNLQYHFPKCLNVLPVLDLLAPR